MALLFMTALPLQVIGSTVILVIRIGWPAFVGIACFAIVAPILNCISSAISDTVNQMKSVNDRRV